MRLKSARVAVSAVFFAACCLLFTGILGALSPAAVFVTSFQAVPRLVLFISTGAIAGAVTFGLVLLSAFLFGRIYCSFVCPLGFLQDIFIAIRRRVKGGFKKTPDLKAPRYLLAAAAFLMLFLGSPWLLNAVEPFSNFGRIASVLVEPALTGLRNTAVSALEAFDLYALKRHTANHLTPAVFSYTACFLLFMGLLSFFKGRLYCNLLCPLGAVLGIASRKSAMALRIEKEKCNSCGLCATECKAGCIDAEKGVIDRERCVMCFNCAGACPQGAITYSTRKGGTHTDKTRRAVLKGVVGAAIALAAAAVPVRLRARKTPVVKKSPLVTPPGSGSRERFTRHCIACGLCVTACPTKVLTHSVMEYGAGSMFVPRLDFSVDYCLYDCTRCSHACPAGAIEKISTEEKKRLQIGVAKFITENCLVETHGSHCTICNEFCPTKAVSLVPHKNGPDIPKVIEEICVGCGACEYMCPAAPKAIYVEGSAVHGRAEKPVRRGRGRGAKDEERPRQQPPGGFPF